MRYRKKKLLTDNILAKKDNISELKNDEEYTNTEKVSKIVADIVTAEYIESRNAKFTRAQVEQLMAGDVDINGLFTAREAKIAGKIIVTDPQTGEILFEADSSKIDAEGHKNVNIAGWKVNVNELTAPNKNVALYTGNDKKADSLITSGKSPARIMAGTNDPNTATFMVLDDGSCYASKFKTINNKTHGSETYKCDVDFSNGFVDTMYPVYTLVNSPDEIYYILLSSFWFNNTQFYRMMLIDCREFSPFDSFGNLYEQPMHDGTSNIRFVMYKKAYVDANMQPNGYDHIFIN